MINAALKAIASCPCCLLRPPLRGLMTPYTHLNTTEIYSDMLEECFDIRLNNVSSSITGICEVCIGRLRDASNFKLQMQRSQLELQKRLERALMILEGPVAAVKTEVNQDGNMLVLEGPVATVKTEMGQDGRSRNLLLIERPVATVKTEIDEDGTSGNLLDEEPAAVMADTARVDNVIRELARSGTARSVSARAREQLAMDCSVRLERLRGDEAPRACHISRNIEDHHSSLATHIREHDDSFGVRVEEGAHTCDTFRKQSRSTRKPSTIKRIPHMTGNDHSRKMCLNKVASKNLFTKLGRTHVGKKANACEICSKQFTTKYDLTKHIRVHTGQKPYSCKFCNKKFTQQSHLKTHIRIHPGQKPYSCTICNKKFLVKTNLTSHIRIHAGQKLYRCEICDEKFLRQRYLKIHIKIHKGQKPYICRICHKKFTQKSNLKTHITVHTRQILAGLI